MCRLGDGRFGGICLGSREGRRDALRGAGRWRVVVVVGRCWSSGKEAGARGGSLEGPVSGEREMLLVEL